MGPTISNIRTQVDAAGVSAQAHNRLTSPKRDTRTDAGVEQPVAMAAADQHKAVRQAVDEANVAIRNISTGVEFRLDDDTGNMVVRVIDTDTKEVLRQIPTKEMLAIARAIEHLQGLLIDHKA